MDKAILTIKDIDALLAWRDEHQDFVRSMPSPLKGIEIICKDSGYTIKGIRKKDKLDLYLSLNGKSLGASHFKITWINGQKRLAAVGKAGMNVSQEDLQTVITVYCSLMALMAYGKFDGQNNDPSLRGSAHTDMAIRNPNPAHSSHGKSRKDSVVYLLRRGKNGPFFTTSGHHASPSGIFSVRGHYRHYQDGRVIWIDEYKKGAGKRKDKTYKL